jgi:hypothetical protein
VMSFEAMQDLQVGMTVPILLMESEKLAICHRA